MVKGEVRKWGGRFHSLGFKVKLCKQIEIGQNWPAQFFREQKELPEAALPDNIKYRVDWVYYIKTRSGLLLQGNRLMKQQPAGESFLHFFLKIFLIEWLTEFIKAFPLTLVYAALRELHYNLNLSSSYHPIKSNSGLVNYFCG